MSVKPEDILADDQNSTQFGGMTLRKGTVAAALANADILESSTASGAEKAAALQTIKELAPALVAVGLYKHLVWKNTEIQKIVEDAAKSIS